ncbi:hypothetical protein [Moraxella lacunata]|uniref:hypothetical protein n=1 Tax=Moraxella lacunata TaxID=477 RepID=UPI003EDE7A69
MLSMFNTPYFNPVTLNPIKPRLKIGQLLFTLFCPTTTHNKFLLQNPTHLP